MSKRISQMVKEHFETRFKGLPGCIVVDYQGLDGGQLYALRTKLRKANVHMTVVKNSLARRAFTELKAEAVKPLIEGPAAIIYGNDPVAVAREVFEWKKANKGLAIRGGVLGAQTVNEAGLRTLADIPARPVLVSILLGAMQGPIRGLVSALAGIEGKLVYVLDAIRSKREQATPEAAPAA